MICGTGFSMHSITYLDAVAGGFALCVLLVGGFVTYKALFNGVP